MSHVSHTTIEYHRPPGVTAPCNAGSTCYIGRIDDKTVLKYPFNDDYKRFVVAEAGIYEALGTHPHILKYYGRNDYGIVLEYAANGAVKHYLQKQPTTSWKQRITWCCELAEAIRHTHSKHVLHCNISAANVLLDDDLRLKLADFQGCFKDPLTGVTLITSEVTESSKWRLPREFGQDSERSDIFALGSAIFEIMAGSEPFPELDSAWDDEEIERRFKAGQFPDVSCLPGGAIIHKCWLQQYGNVSECLQDLKELD